MDRQELLRLFDKEQRIEIEYPSIYDLDTLLAHISQGYQPTYLFFWGHRPPQDGQIGKHCLSQWWPASFQIDGILYPTAEHYMMAEKARLFGDIVILEKILRASGPPQVKKLGRKIRHFDDAVWQRHRFEIVVRGNQAKFGQNAALGAWLVSTQPCVLVEASPVDQIWGIGMAKSDPRAGNPAEWQGLNLLGFALMKVRQLLWANTPSSNHLMGR